MNNNLNLKDTNIIEQIKNSIKEDLSNIKSNYKNKIIVPLNLYDLNEHLIEFQNYNNDKNNDIIDLITIDYLFFFRTAIINSNSLRILILQILRNCIKINPLFTNKILDAMIPILFCKYFEDLTLPFEERYSYLKIGQIWLKLSDANFPIIFLQSIALIAKSDNIFKIGCIEFLRMTSILRPDLVSTVGGFSILINSFIDQNLPKDLKNKIIVSIMYILNTPNKRKYFNGLGDFYKIFSIFTKSDFSSGTNIDTNNSKQLEEIMKENEKLGTILNATVPIIVKFLFTWPGYFYIMRNKLIINSFLVPLNNDVNILIKKAILNLFKQMLDKFINIYDNFNKISSEDRDIYYINKIYIAFIIQEFFSNNLNDHFMKFIEEVDSDELRNYALKIFYKFNILFAKILNNDLRSSFTNNKIEKLKWFEESDEEINIPERELEKTNVYNNDHIIDYLSNFEKHKAPIQIKIMNILDTVFHHLECRDTPFLTPETISSEIIIAMNSMMNLDYIKKYDNQYAIETAKEEIYSKDDEYIQIVKNSKILDLKECQQWDWTQIDSLLDIIEVKKELLTELNRQKIFKKLLYAYSPSKNLIVKMPWKVSNFFYGAIGNKLFKILSNNQEGIEILDSPNEDTIFLKANSWIKDVMQCLDDIHEKIENEENPFHISKINNTLSRNIFIFIGIISNSKLGDDYLNKQGFYTLLNKFISVKCYKFDYLLTLIIDNINLNSKHTSNWVQKILENGNNDIKRYLLNQIRCLLTFGKEVIIDIKFLLNILSPDFQDIDKKIVSIIYILIKKGKVSYPIFKEKSILEKISQADKKLLYILMRDEKIYSFLIDIIKKEAEKTDICKLVEEYEVIMKSSLKDIFDLSEERSKKFYLTINLSEINDKYSYYYEYFWIKQLPLNVVVQKIEDNFKRVEFQINNYLEYNIDENIIKMVCKVPENQKISIDNNTGIQIICFLGRLSLNKNCNVINNASNFLALSYKDILKNIVPYRNIKNIFLLKKDGINIILTRPENSIVFYLDKIFFNIQILPNSIQGLKTPVNLITELINSEKGYEIIEQKEFIEKLLLYLDNVSPDYIDKNSNKINSALYILSKILINKNAKYLDDKYEIIKKMCNFFDKCDDYSMKGTLAYITSFIALNDKLNLDMINSRSLYFSNTTICYPKDSISFNADLSIDYENKILEDEMNLIESEIILNENAEIIYDYTTNLINNITSKESVEYLQKCFRNGENCLKDVNLYIKIFAILSIFKFKKEARKIIMNLFHICIFSNEISLDAMSILKNIDDDLFNSHQLE